jgi:glutamine synthetase
VPHPLSHKISQTIKEHDVQYVDLRFTDTHGKEQHVSVGAGVVDDEFLALGKMFDGSSIAGWRHINDSDMILRPDLETAFIDPFFEESTLVLRCDIIDPSTMQDYARDPRAIARRAEAYLKASGLGDVCYFGPEPEFFIFDEARWKVSMENTFFQIDSSSAAWNSGKKYEEGNMGHRPRVKGGYFPVPPVDAFQDLRSAMCTTLKSLGMQVETHHHEVATAGQTEINLRFNSLLAKADEMQVFKYVVHNVAHAFGKTATFMPKPLAGDNGSGMHCHVSIFKNGENLFSGDQYAGLSQFALHFIAGIIKHARTLNAFTNPTTNSYKRLVPGFEAPVMLAYSARNRSASIRMPHVHSAKARRIEVRFPDPLANPYLAFSAIMMAGLDGVRNKLDPGAPMDQDLYELTHEELKKVPTVCASLEEALHALETQHDFLLEGGVFTKDLIDAYVKLKMEEVTRFRATPHPLEFEMYYSS